MRVTRLIKERLSSKRVMLAGFCALAVVAGAGLGVAAKQISSAATGRDCDTNSIDYKNMHGGCGAANASELVADIKSNSPSDLKNIYAHYGLTSSQYSNFIDHARMGTVYKDGRVVVDGQTVATSAWSVGRHNFSGRSKITISGKTYYTGPTSKSFAANSIPAMVMFDRNGKMVYAFLTACGNPVTGHPKTPTYSCDDLQQKSLGNDTYSFTTKASAGNGAKIAKVVYNFGDGSAEVTKTSPTDAVTHKFTKTATVTVKVYVSVPGKQTVVVQSVKCSKKVTVTPPAPEMSCDQLKLTPGKADEQGNTPYTLNAAASVKNATINSYTFTFGDQKNQTVTTSATTASTTHTYAPGNYTAKVSVNVTANGKSQDVTDNEKCTANITVKVPECKPGIPVGSPECAPASMTCDGLALTSPTSPDDQSGLTAYRLTANASATNATINKYTFSFGDQTPDAVINSSANTASVTHTYKPGEYDLKVVVTMTADGKTQDITSSKCASHISLKETPHCTVPGKENLPPNSPECVETCTGPNGQTYPKGSDQCETCTAPNGQTYPKGSSECETCTAPSGQTYPKGSKECETCTDQNGQQHPMGSNECQPQVLAAATELPNTGPGQVAIVFAAASILGVVAHRVFLRRRAAQAK